MRGEGRETVTSARICIFESSARARSGGRGRVCDAEEKGVEVSSVGGLPRAQRLVVGQLT